VEEVEEGEDEAAIWRCYPGAEPGGGILFASWQQVSWRERRRGRRGSYGRAITVFEEEERRFSRLTTCVTPPPPGVMTIPAL
jgi:hypothetical protein